MKKIGIDARLYSQTGVGTYLQNLLHWLPKFLPDSSNVVLYVLPSDEGKITLNDKRFTVCVIDAPWHGIEEQTSFYSVLMSDRLDLMHFTYFSYPVRYKRPFIATIHDLTPLLFKTGRASTLNPILYEAKYQIFKFVLSSQIRNSKMIITPTKAVKNQIVKLFGDGLDKKIAPIYEGVNFKLMEAKENIALNKDFSKPYFLYVGNFYPHKNVERLVEAYAIYKNQSREEVEQLVLVGPDNMFSKNLRKKINKKGIGGVRFVHGSNIEDLVFFYKNARALVNPSLSEGFGLPLIEASYFGCPVIASDIPVFHEILGDKFTSFDPKNTQDIADKLKIQSYACLPASTRGEPARQKLRVEKKENKVDFNNFSFENMTKNVVQLYKNE